MMNKKWNVFPVVLMILTGLVFVAVFSCNNNPSSVSTVPVKTTYTGTDTNAKEYTLIVTDNKTYELKINGVSISTGRASKNGDVFTLTPNSGGDSFTVTVSGRKITKIEGDIAPDDGGDPITPGEIIATDPITGVWEWSLSDDSETNEQKGASQSVFTPGGASRITNAVEDPVETTPKGNPVKRPFVHPAGTVKDNDGNTIDAEVYNFTGFTKVTSDNRAANTGARFPMVGWEAVPDEETLELLKTAYGYQFWVRLNSSTASNWSFLTAVVTDFTPEEGYEYKHYFGNQPGDTTYSGKKHANFTGSLITGRWYKIVVIMDESGFNMDQDGWLYQYPPTVDPKGPFNQDKAQKIQWQIPLQHQVGAGVTSRSGDPYDIVRGSYDFNVDFYGLELLE
jgi:hypothetical protein